MKKYVVLSLFFCAITSCSMLVMDGANLTEGPSNLLLVVDNGMRGAIEPELEMYQKDLEQEGVSYETLYYEGSASDLRTSMLPYADGSWTALMVGNIPWVHYEQTILEGYEQFPVDVYYSAPNSTWQDQDGNSVFDAHSELAITLPVSRITGTPEEIKYYFQKNHNYRSGSLTFQDRSLVFKDDDWSDYRSGNDFGLGSLTSSVTIIENPSDSLKPKYIEELAGGYRYVYQWIHAIPRSLFIEENDQYNAVTVEQIQSNGITSGFYNLFNCKVARFTENNLGMTYLTGTNSGLAVLGSTKVGGNFEPLEFHRSLAAGLNWGTAYRNWYNQTGSKDDSWYLGMVILGDPTLRAVDASAAQRGLKGGTSVSELIPPNEEEKQKVLTNLQQFEQLQN